SPLRDCSTGPVILSCTCSDEEPGAVVITWICGSETEGMSSWRIVVMMNTPMMDTAMHTSAMKDLLFRLSVARRFILLLEGCATGGCGRRGRGMPRSDGSRCRLLHAHLLMHAWVNRPDHRR